MSYSLVTPPAIEPLTVAELKVQLRLGATSGEPAPTAPTIGLLLPAVPGLGTNGAHRVGCTFVTATGETQLGPLSAPVTIGDQTVNGQLAISNLAIGGALVLARNLYLVPAAGGPAQLAATIADNVSTTWTLSIADASLGVQAPIVNTTDDPQLLTLIAVVRQRAELVTQRALITQTWNIGLDTWPAWQPDGVSTLLPAGGWVDLPKPPLQQVVGVTYLDLNGNVQTWAPLNYVVDAPTGDRCRKGRLGLAWACIWPVIRYQMNAITIQTVNGYGTTEASVPALLRQAMLLDCGTLYEVRSSVLTGSRAAALQIPSTSIDIYRSFRAL